MMNLKSRNKNYINGNNVLKHMSILLFISVPYLNFISYEIQTVSQNGKFHIALTISRLSTP